MKPDGCPRFGLQCENCHGSRLTQPCQYGARCRMMDSANFGRSVTCWAADGKLPHHKLQVQSLKLSRPVKVAKRCFWATKCAEYGANPCEIRMHQRAVIAIGACSSNNDLHSVFHNLSSEVSTISAVRPMRSYGMGQAPGVPFVLAVSFLAGQPNCCMQARGVPNG